MEFTRGSLLNSRFAAWISYQGTDFCGWQRQDREKSGPQMSVQESLELALNKVLHQNVRVHASGRTDAGVHAIAQVVHFEFINTKSIQPEKLRGALNAHLPSTIRVWRVRAAEPSFHATDCATRKTYAYWILEGPTTLPGLDPLLHWVPYPIHWSVLRKAAKNLVGTHDFKAFQGRGGSRKTTVREIFAIEVRKQAEPHPWASLYVIRITGSGFLKQMVRSIVGTLLDIGRGALPPDRIRQLIKTQDRTLVGKTAPSKGLWLESVTYDRNASL